MKLLVAIFLVFIAMSNAEPPRFQSFARQTAPAPARDAPYPASGWRPQGASFSLPQQTYSAPPQTYGPPPPGYAPPQEPEQPTTTYQPETTTEVGTEETSTNQPQFERIRDNRRPAKVQHAQQQAEASPVYLVVPQQQNYYYALQRNAPLLGVPQGSILAPSRLTAIPVGQAITAPIYSPYASYVQTY